MKTYGILNIECDECVPFHIKPFVETAPK